MTTPRHATPPGTVCVCRWCSPDPRDTEAVRAAASGNRPRRRARIYRARPGMWIIIDRDYATYSARTWRAAMDLVSPPVSNYCGQGICSNLEGHEGECST